MTVPPGHPFGERDEDTAVWWRTTGAKVGIVGTACAVIALAVQGGYSLVERGRTEAKTEALVYNADQQAKACSASMTTIGARLANIDVRITANEVRLTNQRRDLDRIDNLLLEIQHDLTRRR